MVTPQSYPRRRGPTPPRTHALTPAPALLLASPAAPLARPRTEGRCLTQIEHKPPIISRSNSGKKDDFLSGCATNMVGGRLPKVSESTGGSNKGRRAFLEDAFHARRGAGLKAELSQVNSAPEMHGAGRQAGAIKPVCRAGWEWAASMLQQQKLRGLRVRAQCSIRFCRGFNRRGSYIPRVLSTNLGLFMSERDQ